MTGPPKYFLKPRLFLSFWILSLCLLFGYCQPPQPAHPAPHHHHHLRPTLEELSHQVQNLVQQFDGFKAHVKTELSKLSGSVSACCTGGGGDGMRPIDLQITKTKVSVNPAGDVATYTIEYKAIKDPRVIWRVDSEPAIPVNSSDIKFPGDEQSAISDEGIITKSFRNGQGVTTLRIDSTKDIVASVIVDHVTFVISFRPKPPKTAEMPLRPTNFFVDAGAHGSFNYVKAKPLNILVSSPKFYPGFSSSPDYQWSFWMANTTAQPPLMEEYPQWKEMNGGMVRVGPIRTLKKIQHPTNLKIVYELMTDKGDYDGILIFSKFYTATDNSSVITGLTEMRYVFVSRQDRYDPFPNGFISFVRRDPAVKPCIFNKTCSISCHAVGVVPEAIHLYKIQRDASMLEVNLPKLEVREPYMLYAHFAIKHMVEEDEGDYVCSAYSRTSRTDIRTTLLLSEPVEFVNGSSGVVWGHDTATVTCAAKGRPLPKVRIFENYAWQNEMLRTTNSYLLEKAVDRAVGGEYVASVRLTIRLSYMTHIWRVICIAENQFALKATDFEIKSEPRHTHSHQHWNAQPLGPPQMGPAPAPRP